MSNKAYSNTLPDSLEKIDKKGQYAYRYNFKEETVTIPGEDGEMDSQTQYSWSEVYVWAPLSSSKIISAVLLNEYDVNYEQKLINEYNSALLGLYSTDEENNAKKQAYIDFITYRKSIKETVERDLLNFNLK